MSSSFLPNNIYYRYFINFILIFFILNLIFNFVRIIFTDQDPFLSAFQDPKTDIPVSWPISIFALRLPRFFLPTYESHTSFGVNHIMQRNPLENIDILVAIVYLVIFFLFYNYIKKIDTPHKIYLIGFFAIILSNSIQGIDEGIIEPLTGEPGDSGRVYHHDVIHIDNILEFVNDYDSLQSNYELSIHSIVHPPGPVIIYYFLHLIFSNPLFSSIFLMSVSLLIVFYLHSIICHNNSKSTANFVCLFFVFLPSTQIYFLSSIDSLISLFFLGTIYHFVSWTKSRDNLNYSLCLIFLILSTFMTFTTVILFFILFAYSFSYLDVLPQQIKISDRSKTIGKDVILLFLPVALVILLTYFLFGYNYIEGFLAASEYENRHYSSGFLLFDYPVSYFATRLENIAELIFFLGPIGTIFLYRGLAKTDNDYDLFFKYGLICFLLIIITGAYRTGETARAVMYLYPLMLITISNFIDKSFTLTTKDKKHILQVTFFQVLLMQMFGWYYW